MSVDLRLYALVDPDRSGGHELGALSAKLVRGGATLVQLRDKTDWDARRAHARRVCGIDQNPLLTWH